VEAANARGLFALDGELESFEARDQGDVRELDKLSGARRVVELRVGAKVLLTRTIDPKRRLVNGAQGRVISFDGTGNARRPVVSFGPPANVEVAVSHEVFEAKCGAELVGARAQLPLELAWAVSVHKSQGMTLNAVEVSLENLFEHGQAYVALSRARSLDGLFLQGNEGCLRRGIHADERCLAFHRSLLTSGAAPQPCQSPAKKDSCTPRKQGAPGGA
jgi:ATP-dependent DNA helicase PIF1